MKKVMIKISVFFCMINFMNSTVYSQDYVCPKIPMEFQIGQTLINDWYIWDEDSKLISLNKFYYGLFPKKLFVKYWGGFETGWVNKGTENQKTYIACCVLYKKNSLKLCAYKNVEEKICKADIRGKGPSKFVCEDDKPIKLSHEI